MNAKSLIWLLMIVGTYGGSLLPTLWGASAFSLSSVLWGGAGGFLGIWVGWKLSR